jgi:AraC-like DNA-binding protein
VEERHDVASGPLAPSSAADALSDLLQTVRLTGALFFRVEASTPWVAASPAGDVVLPVLLPSAQRLVSYHVITAGPCWAELADGQPVRLESGDIVVIPGGDAYQIASGADLHCPPDLAFFRRMARGEAPLLVTEGGGGPGRLGMVCGFLGCDGGPFNPLLETLPALLHVPRTAARADDHLHGLVDHVIAECEAPRPGGASVLRRLGELLFVEVIRRHVATMPAEERGWLSALRDPQVGHALALLHRRPAERWTLEGLAHACGLSRSTLAERFTHLVGQPPMQYLALWRMQVAARLLAEGTAKVSAVAEEVGYESEAAFSRAFKKAAGKTPSAWRRR